MNFHFLNILSPSLDWKLYVNVTADLSNLPPYNIYNHTSNSYSVSGENEKQISSSFICPIPGQRFDNIPTSLPSRGATPRCVKSRNLLVRVYIMTYMLEETSEGIEKASAVGFYSRLFIITHLLPLLSAAAADPSHNYACKF